MNWLLKLLSSFFGTDAFSSQTLFEWGNQAYRQGNPREALSLYRKALQIEPANVKYRAGVARALIKLGRLAEARDLTVEILSDYPGYGYAQQLLHKIDTGLQQSHASSLSPSSSQSNEPLSLLRPSRRTSVCYELTLTAPSRQSKWYGVYELVQNGCLSEAMIRAEYYLQTYPNPDYGYYLLGYIYDRLGRWEEAANSYRSAIQLGRRGRVYNRLDHVTSLLQ